MILKDAISQDVSRNSLFDTNSFFILWNYGIALEIY